jgi:hypothetical protein
MPEQEPDPITQRDLGDVERWVILWGYVGEAVTRPGQDGGPDQTGQRLYLDLTKEHWLEVNVDNIRHRQDLERGRGSLLWVPRDAWVARVDLARAADFNAASGFLSGGFWPQSPFPDDPYGSAERKTSIPYRCC